MEVPTLEQFNNLLKTVEFLKQEVSKLSSMPSLADWVTVDQACKLLNRSDNTVREMAKRGDLVYKQGKRKMEICAKSINNYNLKHTVQ
jgi:excisionase family DNA binding protein